MCLLFVFVLPHISTHACKVCGYTSDTLSEYVCAPFKFKQKMFWKKKSITFSSTECHVTTHFILR